MYIILFVRFMVENPIRFVIVNALRADKNVEHKSL